MDTLGNLLALHLHVSPASEHDREQVEELVQAVQEATGESVELAYVDQGYTGEKAAKEAEAHGMSLEDYERLPATLAGLHFVAFACLFLQEAASILTASA